MKDDERRYIPDFLPSFENARRLSPSIVKKKQRNPPAHGDEFE